MHDTPVTREEFEELKGKLLSLNTVEGLLSRFDRVTREWVLGEKAKLETAFSNTLEQRFGSTIAVQDTKNEKQVLAAITRSMKEFEVAIKGQWLNQKTELENSVLKTVRSKVDEIRSMVQEIATTQTSALRNEVDSKLSLYLKDLGSRQKTFEEILETVAQTSTQRALEGLLSSVQQLVTGEISSHLKDVSVKFAELRLDVLNQLSEKVIDKQMILDRMIEIERDISAKAKSIIEFNIEQARANMERNAKAEISEGVRLAASQLVAGLK
jgi:hypothetical protein